MIKQQIFIIENNLQKVGQQYFFHLSRRTTIVQDLRVRRQFSLVSDKVNVKAWMLLKLNIDCERFYLCRLFTIDWFKPEIVTRWNFKCYISWWAWEVKLE